MARQLRGIPSHADNSSASQRLAWRIGIGILLTKDCKRLQGIHLERIRLNLRIIYFLTSAEDFYALAIGRYPARYWTGFEFPKADFTRTGSPS